MGALFGVEQILLSQRNSGLEMNDDAQTQPPAARCPYGAQHEQDGEAWREAGREFDERI
jgi:hypothetical protein